MLAKLPSTFFRNPNQPASLTKRIKELPGLTVSVDQVLYMPDLHAPDDRPYAFVYFITISNNSAVPVTIKGRKWILRPKAGTETVVVEGDGVVGQFPRLAPGEDFDYSSQHFVAASSEAEGAYFAQTDDGKVVSCRIPRMHLRLPDWV
jgi:ApaG protein